MSAPHRLNVLSSGLPGALSQRKVLVETLTYIAVEPGTFRWLAPADVTLWPQGESQYIGRGIQVIRSTEEGWANEPGAVVTEVRVLLGVPVQPEQAVAAILLDAPDDVQDFLEQYAPEVFERTQEWERDLADAPLSVIARHPEDDA